jgi:hypothetical protein
MEIITHFDEAEYRAKLDRDGRIGCREGNDEREAKVNTLPNLPASDFPASQLILSIFVSIPHTSQRTAGG